MTGRHSSPERYRSSTIADFDDQMWPINCAILVLAGFVVGIVIANSDFADPRLLANGYTHLGIVGALVVFMLVMVYWLQGKVRRRLQLCVLLSLLAHLSFAFYVYCNPVRLSIAPAGGKFGGDAQPDDEVIAPDYHWTQAEQPDAEQGYETPVETAVQTEIPTVAAVQPRNFDRPVPVADIPRLPGVEETPLGSSGPGGPLAVQVAAAAAARETPQVVALAMNRQVAPSPELPKFDSETAQPTPAAAGSRPDELQPGSIAMKKTNEGSTKDLTAQSPSARSDAMDAMAPGETTPTAQLPSTISPRAAASQEAPQVAALTMNRQLASPLNLPKLDAETPQPTPAAAESRPDELQPGSIAMKKGPRESAKNLSAAQRRETVEPSEPPERVTATIPAQLPSISPRVAASREDAGPSAIPGRPSSLARSNRGGQGLPSSVLPAGGEPSVAPAAFGSSPGSRIEATSTAAVERVPKSRAPSGPTISAAGTQEFGIGSGLIVARGGVPFGKGTGRPAVAGLSGTEQGPLRAGAVGSFSDRGAPLPVAAAARARASQPGVGGTGLAPGLSATVPRSQTPRGVDLPAAVLPSEPVSVAGAGGLAPVPGGATSSLDVGSVAAVQQSRAAVIPSGRAAVASGASDFGSGSAPWAALPGAVASGTPSIAPQASIASGGPRRGQRSVEGPARVSGGGVARAQNTPMLPGGAAEAVVDQPLVPVAPTTAAVRPIEGGASRLGSGIALADAGMAIAKASGLGRRSGTPPTINTSDLTDLEHSTSLPPLRPLAAMDRRTYSDADITRWTSEGSAGRTAVARNDRPTMLEGTVKEPTEFYKRRTETRHGLGLGDAEGAGFTEPAVELGLGFFARIQFPDGHWSLDRLPDHLSLESANLAEMQSDTAATGLVLLTYLGAGYTHLDEKYRDVVRRGVEWLVKHQKPDGDLFADGSRFTHFYSHGMAAMALCEVYGMTQDPDLREPARKAVEFIVNTQDPRRGGWRYEPRQESDTSVTGWQLMALKSAQMAGLDVPQETLRKIGTWLDRAQWPAGDGRYVYNPWNRDTEEQREGRMPSLAMTAESMLMRMYLGQRRDNSLLLRGAEFLKANLPEVGSADEPQRDCYYWYYATQAMYQMQGEYWTAWINRLSPLLKVGQAREGPLAGSWHPREPVPDRWGHAGGRVYVTAMHLLMLEVYYRHLPLFQELSK